MSVNTIYTSDKTIDDKSLRVGCALLVEYPDSSPFAGIHGAYAVTVWKYKTKVLWMDPGVYQYTTTIMPNKFVRRDLESLDIKPTIMKCWFKKLIKDHENLFTPARLKEEKVNYLKAQKKMAKNYAGKGNSEQRKRKRCGEISPGKMIGGLKRLNSVGLEKIRHSSLFKMSKRQRMTELPSTCYEFPEQLSFNGFFRAKLISNATNFTLSLSLEV